jgi:WD40 repeat protein
MFPPEAVSGNSPKNAHLFRMLRPEFVRSYARALNSDAFSRFNTNSADNEEVQMATKNLVEVRIPSLAEALLIGRIFDPCKYPHNLNLSSILHQEGINVRHYGLLLSLLVSEEFQSKCDADYLNQWIRIVKAEIVYRAMKSRIRSELREIHTNLSGVQGDTFHISDECIAVAQILNAILWKAPHDEVSMSYLQQVQIEEQKTIQQKEVPLLYALISDKFDLSKDFISAQFVISELPRPLIFYKLCKSLNIRISSAAEESRKTEEGFYAQIDDTEIVSTEATVEELNLVSLADGVYLFMKALQDVGERSIRMARMALQKLERASTSVADTYTARELFNARFFLAVSLPSPAWKESLGLLSLCDRSLKSTKTSRLARVLLNGKVALARDLLKYDVRVIPSQGGRVYAARFFSKGRFVIVSSIVSKIFIFDTQTGDLRTSSVVTTDTLNEWIRSIAVIDDEHFVVGGKVLLQLDSPKTANQMFPKMMKKTSLNDIRTSFRASNFGSLAAVSSAVRYAIRFIEMSSFDVLKKDDSPIVVNSLTTFHIEQSNLDIVLPQINGVPSLVASGVGNRILVSRDISHKGTDKLEVLPIGGSRIKIVSIESAQISIHKMASVYVICGCADSTIRIFNLNTSSVLDICLGIPGNQDLKLGHVDEVLSVCVFKLSAQQDMLASAGADGTIRIWNLTTLQCDHVLRGHADGVLCIKAIPSWRVLVSSSSDGTIRLWSWEYWCCVRILSGFHKKHIYTVDAFAPDDTKLLLVSGGSDGVVCVFNFQRNTEQKLAETGRCRPS